MKFYLWTIEIEEFIMYFYGWTHRNLLGSLKIHMFRALGPQQNVSTKNPEYNSLRPSDAYVRWHPKTTLVQIMACRLLGAKPLYEPMLEYCQLDPWEQTSVKF